MWKILRPQIITLLKTLQDTDHQNVFVEISKAPKIRFSGYPSGHVIPSDNTGDYETNVENLRTYSFIARLFAETKIQGIEKAMESLEGIVDSCIDLFDQEDLKQGSDRTIGIGAPPKYTYINIFATPGKWGEFADEEVLMAEVSLKVRFSVDVTS